MRHGYRAGRISISFIVRIETFSDEKGHTALYFGVIFGQYEDNTKVIFSPYHMTENQTLKF